MKPYSSPDLLCFSHLRWGFVYQRPQHLMTRFSKQGRVFYFEEPIFEEADPHLRVVRDPNSAVTVLTPIIPRATQGVNPLLRDLLSRALNENRIQQYVAWYYTPMAMEFTGNLDPEVVVYDCMDELSAFAGAPQSMRLNEEALFRQADLVFTGGSSLYRSKAKHHASVHLFPSSIDASHFGTARHHHREPDDQVNIPRPRFGYSGVIDERMDLELLAEIARQRPHWQFILLGPVVKINPADLPQAPNLHYLGMKSYADLPAYFSGWSIGMLPFAMNESTRFISPTKTPEYLAAGLRVISTPIQDVVDSYGQSGLATIARNPEEFISAGERLLAEDLDPTFDRAVKQHLSRTSWDQTWQEMNSLIRESLAKEDFASVQGSDRV